MTKLQGQIVGYESYVFAHFLAHVCVHVHTCINIHAYNLRFMNTLCVYVFVYKILLSEAHIVCFIFTFYQL